MCKRPCQVPLQRCSMDGIKPEPRSRIRVHPVLSVVKKLPVSERNSRARATCCRAFHFIFLTPPFCQPPPSMPPAFCILQSAFEGLCPLLNLHTRRSRTDLQRAG